MSLAPHHYPWLSSPGARPFSLPKLSAGDSAGLLWQEGLRQVTHPSLVCALRLAITKQPRENTSQECPCWRGCGSSPKAPWQSCHPQRGLGGPSTVQQGDEYAHPSSAQPRGKPVRPHREKQLQMKTEELTHQTTSCGDTSGLSQGPSSPPPTKVTQERGGRCLPPHAHQQKNTAPSRTAAALSAHRHDDEPT